MKKNYLLLIILLSVVMLPFSACSNDDDHSDKKTISYEELPVSSQQFITDHFNGYAVETADKTDANYTVYLQKAVAKTSLLANGLGYKIEFDASGEWVEIEGRYDSALPDNVLALIPRAIVSYVNQNYAGRAITEIKKETYGYKIDLNGRLDVELSFDALGNFIGKDDDNDDDVVISLGELPQPAQTFLSTHFGTQAPNRIVKDDNEYEVKYANQFKVEFDLAGNWIKVDAEKNTMPQSIIALLPAKLTNYITTNYSSNTIRKVETKVSSYEIELRGDIDLVFDKSGEFWGADDNGNHNNDKDQRVEFGALPQSIQTYLNQYFIGTNGTSFLYAEKDSDDYEIKLADGTELEFYLDGNVKKIEVLPGRSIPQSAILPAIASYVQTNYQGKHIEEYEVKKNKGYKVELSGYPEIELLFNENGAFIGLD